MKLFDMPAEARISEMSFPTRVVFGAGALSRLPQEVERLGLRRVLLVTDAGVAKAGLSKRVADVLAAAKVESEVWAKAGPNEVDAQGGAERFKAGGFDGVIAVGGGTALDAAKLVALLAASPGALSRFEAAGVPAGVATVPLIAVPTHAGSGSEVTGVAVVVRAESRRQLVWGAPLMPRAAVCDVELTYGLLPWQTATGGMEAFAHCVEGYVATGFHPLADAVAIDGIARVARSLPTAVQEPKDLSSRSDLMVAALEGAMASEKGSGVCRALAHGLSAVSRVPHGLASAVVLPSVMEFNRGATTARLARIAVAMGDNSISRQEVLAGNAIDRVRRLIKQVGLPGQLRQADVKEADLEAIAQAAFQDTSHEQNPRKCTAEDLLTIVRAAF
jgi:alcohol dehydrogenase class IV